MRITDDQGRPQAPLASDEISTVAGFLEYQRATFAWKCSGLSAAELNATVGASPMTLGGMLKHLAYYEDHWFSHRMCGNDRQSVWRNGHWDADPDWEWHSAAQDPPMMLYELWQDAVTRSRDLLSKTLVHGGLDQPARRNLRTVERPAFGGSSCT